VGGFVGRGGFHGRPGGGCACRGPLARLARGLPGSLISSSGSLTSALSMWASGPCTLSLCVLFSSALAAGFSALGGALTCTLPSLPRLFRACLLLSACGLRLLLSSGGLPAFGGSLRALSLAWASLLTSPTGASYGSALALGCLPAPPPARGARRARPGMLFGAGGVGALALLPCLWLAAACFGSSSIGASGWQAAFAGGSGGGPLGLSEPGSLAGGLAARLVPCCAAMGPRGSALYSGSLLHACCPLCTSVSVHACSSCFAGLPRCLPLQLAAPLAPRL
jgi:hypothetical protein